MVSFEIFVKAMPPSLSELKVLPSFCFAFEIPDNVTASNNYRCLQITSDSKKLGQSAVVSYVFLNQTLAYCLATFPAWLKRLFKIHNSFLILALELVHFDLILIDALNKKGQIKVFLHLFRQTKLNPVMSMNEDWIILNTFY